MSGRDDLPPLEDPQERSVRAGLFVLRLTDDAETHAIAHDPTMQGLIASWQERLAPLLDIPPPVAPPAQLWSRIAVSIRNDAAARSAPAGWRSGARPWQIATVGLAAATLVLMGLLVTAAPQGSPEPVGVAILNPSRPDAPTLVASLDATGRLTILAAGHSAVADAHHDYELWILPEGETVPHSLGVLRASATRKIGQNAKDRSARLMVSLEPLGGSPTGAPTGPVVSVGTLQKAQL